MTTLSSLTGGLVTLQIHCAYPHMPHQPRQSVTATVRNLGWVLYTFSFAACAGAQQPSDTPPTILAAKGDSVHVRLFDATSARPIASTELELYSDNGIRCIKAPCLTDGKSWKGKTDASGRLAIPRGALNATANLKSATYSGDLVVDATPDSSGDWTIELFPEERADPGPHPLKLIDARTHKALANATVRIETRGASAQRDTVRTQTNALGYVFVPFIVMAKGADDRWLVAPGYKDAHIDFAWTRRKMYLEPRYRRRLNHQ